MKTSAKQKTSTTAADAVNQQGNNITPTPVSSNRITQELENLPYEILAAPRFFAVKADKKPKIKAWSNPDLQRYWQHVDGLTGFDTCGHGRGADYLLLDFDHVLTDDGEFVTETAQNWYQWITSQLNDCYCERSISGHGLHIIAKPTADKFGKITNGEGKGILHLDQNDPAAKIELFYKSAGRYCLLTGNMFRTNSRDIPQGAIVDNVLETLQTQIKNQNPPVDKTRDVTQYKKFSAEIQDLINEINSITPEMLEAKGYLQRSKNGAPRPTGYICPWCNSGTHQHQTGALTFYATPTPHFTCHAHGCGGDVIKFLSQIYGVDNHGKDFCALLKRAAEDFDLPYDPQIFAREQKPITTAAEIADCPVALQLPDGYIWSKSGIIYTEPPRSERGREKKIIAARTPIIPTRILHNHNLGTFTYEIAILYRGKWHKTQVAGRTLADPRAIIALADCGAVIDEPKIICRFLNAVIALNPELQEIRVYDQPGWHGDQFIYPTGGDDYICQRGGFDYARDFATHGNAETLKKAIVEACKQGGAVARMYLGTALAAPLIRKLRVTNLQTQLHCKSGGGKTALAKLAAAIYGDPAELMRTFEATEKNKIAIAAAYNDLPTFFDEMETMHGKRAEEQLSQMIYSYAEGKGNQAQKRNGDARQAYRFYGSRLMTAERPILKEHDLRGAYKRLVQIRCPKLFDDRFARNLHFVTKDNFGHFGRQWTEFIGNHNDKISYLFNHCAEFFCAMVEETNKEPTQITAVTAALIALQYFLVCIGEQSDIDELALEQDCKKIVAMLPNIEDLDDTTRAINELTSYVASHEKSFSRETDKGDDVSSFGIVTIGKIFDSGEIAFFPTELRKILEDELHFASADKLIAEWQQDSKLITNKGRRDHTIKIDKQPRKVIHFKPGIINIDAELAEADYYETLAETANA